MSLEFINTLSESRMFRYKSMLDEYSDDDLINMFYLYLVGVYALLNDEKTKSWAQDYASRARAFNNFDHFRNVVNDLYVLGYNIFSTDRKKFSRPDADLTAFRRFLQEIAQDTVDQSFVQRYFLKLERVLKIKNGMDRNIRRQAIEWSTLNAKEKHEMFRQLRRRIMSYSPRAEILDPINHLIYKTKVLTKECDNEI